MLLLIFIRHFFCNPSLLKRVDQLRPAYEEIQHCKTG
jgi:hypothetical protein